MLTTLHCSNKPLLAACLLLAAPAVAALPPDGRGGLHLRLDSHSPYLRDAARATLDIQRQQCAAAVMQCAQSPALQTDAHSRTFCAQARSFTLNGDVEIVGDAQVDEYFSPALRTQARHQATYVLHRDALCAATVMVQKQIDIWQTRLAGTRHYGLRELVGKAPHWTRSDSPILPPSMAALVMQAYPVAAGAAVAAAQGSELVAGHACQRHPVSGPIHGTLCLMPTAAAADGYVSLRASLMSGDTVLLETRAVAVEANSLLPVDKLQPPADAGLQDPARQDPGKPAPANATQRWCSLQAQRSGRNPCLQDDDG
jgi:hypothetical protein